VIGADQEHLIRLPIHNRHRHTIAPGVFLHQCRRAAEVIDLLFSQPVTIKIMHKLDRDAVLRRAAHDRLAHRVKAVAVT